MSDYTFSVVGVGLPPLTYNLPVDKFRRAALYSYFEATGDPLLPYETFKRDNLHAEDLVVFADDFWIVFDYNGKRYKMTVKRGSIIDFASVPKVFTHGTLSKRGQHIDIAAVCHDGLFALNLLPFDDANNVFIGLIDWLDIASPLARRLYKFGVNTRVGRKLYREANPNTHWLKDYVIFEEV